MSNPTTTHKTPEDKGFVASAPAAASGPVVSFGNDKRVTLNPFGFGEWVTMRTVNGAAYSTTPIVGGKNAGMTLAAVDAKRGVTRQTRTDAKGRTVVLISPAKGRIFPAGGATLPTAIVLRIFGKDVNVALHAVPGKVRTDKDGAVVLKDGKPVTDRNATVGSGETWGDDGNGYAIGATFTDMGKDATGAPKWRILVSVKREYIVDGEYDA